MVRCSDCGFMATPGSVGLGPVETRGDGMPRDTPVFSRSCFRNVPGFDYTEINSDRDCADYMAYEPGLDPREHFQLKESRSRADRIRWTTFWVGMGTSAVVLVTGALNLIF